MCVETLMSKPLCCESSCSWFCPTCSEPSFWLPVNSYTTCKSCQPHANHVNHMKICTILFSCAFSSWMTFVPSPFRAVTMASFPEGGVCSDPCNPSLCFILTTFSATDWRTSCRLWVMSPYSWALQEEEGRESAWSSPMNMFGTHWSSQKLRGRGGKPY